MQSLIKQGNKLAIASEQLEIIEKHCKVGQPNFQKKLKEINLFPFLSTEVEILQINLGKMCNQVCEHCHVDAGPDRKEIMTRDTMQYCIDALKCSNIKLADLTGGAPEMNPDFLWLVEEITNLDIKVIVRSNLTILNSNPKYKKYPEFFKDKEVIVISSLPCYTIENTDKQRGEGVFARSIDALKTLNSLGYGIKGSGLELNLVYNPRGAFLPPPQEKLEKDYKRELKDHFGIEFNSLYTITNLPISRFLHYLIATEKYEKYMDTLISSFNPATVTNVMCRNTISVGWDGKLYDCDFNQMLDLQVSKTAPQDIRDFNIAKLSNRKIIVNNHCFGCTAGTGSSCQGSIA